MRKRAYGRDDRVDGRKLVLNDRIFTSEASRRHATRLAAVGFEIAPPVLTVPAEAQLSSNFNAEAATRAYLATIPADAKARSDSYFEGGYWLRLWNFLFGVAMALVIFNLRWSAAIRNAAERVSRFKWVHAVIYWAGYLALTTVLTFPLAVYQGYFREHQYGLATHTFGPWLVDRIKGFGVGLVLGAIIVPLLFAVARRLRRTWWLWGSLVTFVFFIFVATIGPVFITPLFNKVTRLDDPKVTEPILSLARANGIQAKDVFQIDASRPIAPAHDLRRNSPHSKRKLCFLTVFVLLIFVPSGGQWLRPICWASIQEDRKGTGKDER